VRESLVDRVRESILDAVASGRYPVGSQLPAEDVLAAEVGASRLTTREAVKVLASQRVLRSVHGRGTYVNDVSQWVAIDAVSRMQPGRTGEVLRQLFEVRSMLEVGAAGLFAAVASEDDLARMEAQLDAMREAHAAGEADGMMAADLAFHDVILEGCANPFVAAALQPISRALRDARRETSKLPVMRAHAIEEHAKVLAALRSGDPDAAARAMTSHMRQTMDDADDAFRVA
jgi:DNA-binding FadR family transcriptional regulator